MTTKLQVLFPECRHVIVYHAPCADGFCAATVLWEALVKHTSVGQVLTIPVNYDEPVPSDLGPDDVVYIVDFSYKRDVIETLSQQVEYLYVLDHHKTAEQELSLLFLTNGLIFFDMNRSGAMLAFDLVQTMKTALTLTLGLPKSRNAPKLVQYVQDRDLWKFELFCSKEISAYLRSIPFDLEDWAVMLDASTWENRFNMYVTEGTVILRLQAVQISETVDKAVKIDFPVGPDSVPAMTVNTTVNHSEVGHELCNRYPEIKFAVTWFYDNGVYRYSLRSEGYDVSQVAKEFGGGGHPRAAGFTSLQLIKGLS